MHAKFVGLCGLFLLLAIHSAAAAPAPYYVYDWDTETWVPTQDPGEEADFWTYDRSENFLGQFPFFQEHLENEVELEFYYDLLDGISLDIKEPQSLTWTHPLSEGVSVNLVPSLSVTQSDVVQRTTYWFWLFGQVCEELHVGVAGVVGHTAVHNGVLVYNDIENFIIYHQFDLWCDHYTFTIAT